SATHTRNSQARSCILAPKSSAQRSSRSSRAVRRRFVAPRTLAVLRTPVLHTSVLHRLAARRKPERRKLAALHRPVQAPCKSGLRSRRQVRPGQQLELHSRSPESYKSGPKRQPLKMPKRLRRERELYSSPSPSSCLHRQIAQTFNVEPRELFRGSAYTFG